MEYLMKKLITIFEYHEYDAPPNKMKYIIECINKYSNINKLSKQNIDDFIYRLETGEYGTLYKQPTCLLVMWRKYVKDACITVTNKKYQSFQDITKKDWVYGK